MTDKEKLEELLRFAIREGNRHEARAEQQGQGTPMQARLEGVSYAYWRIAEDLGGHNEELGAIFDKLTGTGNN